MKGRVKNQPLEGRLRQDILGINDGGGPEPELQEKLQRLADIPEKGVQHPQQQPESEGKTLQQNQDQGQAQPGPVRVVAQQATDDHQQNHADEQAQKTAGGIAGDKNLFRDADFFQIVGIFDKRVGTTAEGFGKADPGQQPGAEIDGKAGGRRQLRKFHPHDFRKDKGIDHNLKKGIDYVPQKTDGGTGIPVPQIPPGVLPDEFPIFPDTDDHNDKKSPPSQ